MAQRAIATIILAAGHGTRMKSSMSKVLHEVGGRSMVGHVLAAAGEMEPTKVVGVIGDHAPEVGDAMITLCPSAHIAVQAPPKGTGDAVAQALPAIDAFNGTVLVLYADTPLVTPSTLKSLVAKIENGAAVAVLGFMPDDPGAYGRLILGQDGSLDEIVEAREATPDQLNVRLVNSGVMAIDSDFLKTAIPRLTNDNAKGEYYLTDIVAIAKGDGKTCHAVEVDEDEVVGVNSRVELAVAEEIFQDRCRLQAMEEGVTLIDPSTVFFSFDTEIENDVVIEPNVFFGPGVKVSSGTRIKAFSHIEGASLGEKSMAGPFVRLRPGAEVGANAKIGNFVEIKKTKLGEGAKVSHLTYLGDAVVGKDANIGAGTITCNYDGFNKNITEIGAEAFIGSNSALVAPVKIGDGAYIGSGSVITKNVPDHALSVARGRQKDIPGWAKKFRDENKK